MNTGRLPVATNAVHFYVPKPMIMLFAAVFVALAQAASAETFIFNKDMNNNRLENLVGVSNAQVYDEIATASTKYWAPVASGVTASVTYGYSFPNPIQQASFYANLLNFTSGDEVWLDVSTDNVNFTNLFYRLGTNGAGTQVGFPQGLHPESKNPGLPPQSFDLTSNLVGSNNAFIRARMRAEYTITAQFMRTADFIPGFEAPNVYQLTVVTVPEPSTYALTLAGLACGGFSMWRRRKRIARASIAATWLALVVVFLFTANARAVTIDWVTVGNPGNVGLSSMYSDGKMNTFGAVAYDYQIGRYEVTIQQYTDFLNATAKSDPYSLYNTSMASDLNIAGISRSGISGDYAYSVIGPFGATPPGANSPGNRPITYVSWFDAARFANWMHNGQGSGSTETGAYTLVGGQTNGTAPAKNPDAQFYIPTENEWFKAAFYSPHIPQMYGPGFAGYHYFATQSSDLPGNNIGTGANQANFADGGQFNATYCVTQSSVWNPNQNYLTDVGAFTDSPSYYGTFDQNGNVWELNDLTGAADPLRGLRGGAWNSDIPAAYLSSWGRYGIESYNEQSDVGFRLASPVPVPEPSTYALTLAGLACGGFSMWRRRKRHPLAA